ncbi:MAG: hypothetical protein L6R41_008122, partial [Letrouitia leprolyta]
MSFFPGQGYGGGQQHGGYPPPNNYGPPPPQNYGPPPPQNYGPPPPQQYPPQGGYNGYPPQAPPSPQPGYGYNQGTPSPRPYSGGYGPVKLTKSSWNGDSVLTRIYYSPHQQQVTVMGLRHREGLNMEGVLVRLLPDLFQAISLHGPGLPSVNSNAYVQGNHNAPPPPPQTMQSFGNGAPQGYSFQYSNCTGRRKALLIGVNYFGQKGQLRGCINDVKNMSTYLNGNFGYAREDMVILTDDQQNPMSQPTKANILRAMHWLVKDAKPNDSLFFHYS